MRPRSSPPREKKREEKRDAPEYKKDLRDLLARMTSSDASVAEEEKPVEKKEVPKKEKRTESTEKKKPTQSTKDGKGITDEGRKELRDLLSSITTQPSQQDVPKTQLEQKPPTSQRPAPGTHESQTLREVPKPVNTSKTAPAKKELSKEDMEDMLHVEKPKDL